jgi:serine/threonine protein kinase
VVKEKYKIMDFIKGGGFGDVFLAKHTEKGYDVAVKIVSHLPRMSEQVNFFQHRGIHITRRQ